MSGQWKLEWPSSILWRYSYIIDLTVIWYSTVIDCGVPLLATANSTGLSIAYTSTTFNSSAIYTCAVGYSTVGTSVRTCLNSGQWSGEPPQCQSTQFYAIFCNHNISVVDCGDLSVGSSVLGGLTVSFPSTIYNSTATYRCTHEGYQLVCTPIRTCQTNGSWSGQEPCCGSMTK